MRLFKCRALLRKRFTEINADNSDHLDKYLGGFIGYPQGLSMLIFTGTLLFNLIAHER